MKISDLVGKTVRSMHRRSLVHAYLYEGKTAKVIDLYPNWPEYVKVKTDADDVYYVAAPHLQVWIDDKWEDFRED